LRGPATFATFATLATCAAFFRLLGCSTHLSPSPAGGEDAAVEATTGPLPDASADSSRGSTFDAPPCLDYPGQRGPSTDCLFLGACPLGCAAGTASAYWCAAGDASLAFYPSVFTVPAGVVEVVALEDASDPWDARAFVSCGPLACVRWSLADHLDGGSAWSGDPCGDAGDAVEAWACPASPGVLPPPPGCLPSGDALGGDAGSPLPLNQIWCCPPSADGGVDAPSDGATADRTAAGAADK
jgi:hypothetical protein